MTTAAPDYDEIVRVVQLYIEGWNDRDVGKFKEAFHENAWMFFTDAEGALHRSLLADDFEEWAATSEADKSGRVLSVLQAGDVAAVLLAYDNANGKSWVDLHSLLRIDGVWKIMNKTATHTSRAGRP